jgi:hypothetical protein
MPDLPNAPRPRPTRTRDENICRCGTAGISEAIVGGGQDGLVLALMKAAGVNRQQGDGPYSLYRPENFTEGAPEVGKPFLPR